MATVKIRQLKQNQTKSGYPIVIEVIHNRKRAIKTLLSVPKSQWDGQQIVKHPHASVYNRRLRVEADKARKRIEHLERIGQLYTAKDIIEGDVLGSLSAAIERYAQRDHVSWRGKRKYMNVKKKIEEFGDVDLVKIDMAYAKDFHAWLKQHPALKSPVTVSRYMGFLKTVFRAEWRAGRLDDRELVEMTIRRPRARKERLTRKEFNRFRKCPIHTLPRDTFVLAVYLRGIRVSDLLKLQRSNIKGDRIVYRMQKNEKLVSIKIKKKIRKILDRYEGEYLLPWVKLPKPDKPTKEYDKHLEVQNSEINKKLKVIAAACGIDKPVSMHMARHTFAGLADEKKVGVREIQHMLNHSSVKVTEQYLRDLRSEEELDDATDRVF